MAATNGTTVGSWGLATWLASVPRATRALIGGRIRLSRVHKGDIISTPGGRYLVFRETVKVTGLWPNGGPAVLHLRFRLRFVPAEHRGLRHAMFKRVSILITLIFVGLPGFRSKWWVVDPQNGDYAGLYEWDTPQQAEACATGLVRLLKLVSVPGSVSWETTPGYTVREYLAKDTAMPPQEA